MSSDAQVRHCVWRAPSYGCVCVRVCVCVCVCVDGSLAPPLGSDEFVPQCMYTHIEYIYVYVCTHECVCECMYASWLIDDVT